MKRDLKRQKLQENKDAPAMVARMNELHDTTLTRRGKMMLPAPQVGPLLGVGAGWLRLGVSGCIAACSGPQRYLPVTAGCVYPFNSPAPPLRRTPLARCLSRSWR